MLETLEKRDLMSATAVDDIATTVRNAPFVIDVLANDLISDLPNITISILPNTAKAGLSVTATNTILYTPNLNAIGPDTFYYTITTLENEVSLGSVSVTILKTSTELYADYQFLVAQADLVYFNTVQPALTGYQTTINNSPATALTTASAYYAQYIADRLLASNAYDLAHVDAITTFQEAVLQARITSNDRINAALEAYSTTTDVPSADLQSAIDAAAAQYDAAALIINGDYNTAVAPFITARDAAKLIALADPSDAVAQAAWVTAESDLLNAETTFGAVRDTDLANAVAVQQSAEQAASATYLPTLTAGSAAFDAELNGANTQYHSDEEAAWAAAFTEEYIAQLAFRQAEQTAWDNYAAALSSINTLQWGLEYSQLFQFLATANAALPAWQTAEADAWQQYLTDLAAIPNAPAPGVEQANPAFVLNPPYVNAPIITALPRLEPVLAAAVREEFFVAQPNPLVAPTIRDDLDISGETDTYIVRRAIAFVDVRYRLNEIPVVVPNAVAPVYFGVLVDNSVYIPAMTGNPAYRRAYVTAAQLARINIRANLVNLKQGLVNRIYNMVINNPPAGVAIVNADVAAMANRTADDLIRMTDLFLRTHPGARPELGTRNYVANAFEWQNRFSHPWCADWTGAMMAWIHTVIRDRQHPANTYLEFDFGQANSTVILQHNFVIVRPRNYAIQLTSPWLSPAADPVVLLFDPWRELLPIAYHTIPWNWTARRAPTNVIDHLESAEYIYYRDNINNRNTRFSDLQLRLGSFLP